MTPHPLTDRRPHLSLEQLEDLLRGAIDADNRVASVVISLAIAPERMSWQPHEIERHAMAHAIDAWEGRCSRTGGKPWMRSFGDPMAERACPGCAACGRPGLHCGIAVHLAIAADPVAFGRCTLIGYQEIEPTVTEPADVVEIRDCTRCGCTIGRSIGAGILDRLIEARLDDDIAMIARCRLALRGDAEAIAALAGAQEMERLIAGAA